MSTAFERGEHGRTSYRLGCRCRVCVRAMRVSSRAEWALRQLARGREPAYRVPVSPVVAHVERLQARGLTLDEIARRADISPSTLSRALRHARMSNLAARRVLAIEP